MWCLLWQVCAQIQTHSVCDVIGAQIQTQSVFDVMCAQRLHMKFLPYSSVFGED